MAHMIEEDRTLGQRAADIVRNGMGSWPFVFGFMVAMGIWAYLNSVTLKGHAFDPYPYILLNLMLSTLAGLQGAILLIAAKRADAVMDRIIQHILKNTDLTIDEIKINTKLTEEVHNLAKAIHDHIAEDKKKNVPIRRSRNT